MRILVTGAGGQLASCLRDLQEESKHRLFFYNRKQLDITQPESITAAFEQCEPDLLINTAAYTAVDRAESEPELAYVVNANGPENLGIECQKRNIPIIHISTDYVFDGNATSPYLESDKTNPQSVYGASKLEGEIALQQACARSIIIRTAWVFSEHGNNFFKTMLRLFNERAELSIVNDQVGCPTYAGDIARGLIQIADAIEADDAKYGLFHLCGDVPCSWFEFASEIYAQAEALKILTKPVVLKAIPSESFPTPAKRPQYSVLDCTAVMQHYGVVVSDWKFAISCILSEIE